MFTVLGLRKGQFTNPNGELVDWRKIYLLEERKDFIYGGEPFNVSVPADIFNELEKYGEALFLQKVNAYFNNKGKLTKIEVL